MGYRRQLAAALAGISSLALFAGTAQAQQRKLDLPAGNAVDTLQSFAVQSGLQIIAPVDKLDGARTPALVGTYDVRAALRQFIRDTNLVIASDNGKVIVLRPRDGAAKPASGASLRPAAFTSYAAQAAAPVGPAPAAPAAPPPADAAPANDIVVVGTQIKGSKMTEALPVTVVGRNMITSTAAVSGDELFHSIPQMGSMTFNSQYLPGSSNSARGDVGSVNLRELGVGNTLVLLNGRRMVQHPVSQADENLVPVISYNTNTIPVSGVERLEVLRDGAAAIYGTDAVAGVVNTVLTKDFKGVSLESQYGFAQGTHMRESTTNGTFGHNFEHGNITLFASYTHRDAMLASDEPYTASSDKRALFAGTSFANIASLDGRSATSDWASLATPAANGTIRMGTTALTSSSGLFHIQPTAEGSCAYTFANGTCLGTGSLATSGINRDARYDAAAANNPTIIPGLDRINLFLTGHYDVAPDVQLYGEAGYYHATTHSIQSSTGTLSSVPITIPASNYWNPFGPVTFADGTVNPNRLAGLTNVPASGLPVTIRSYNFSDAGASQVIDHNYQYRLLAGVKFRAFNFDWDSAFVYSQAGVTDSSTGISATLLQQNLALSNSNAYNPFNGGNTTNYSLSDSTPSNQAAINAITVWATRKDTTSLAMGDLKGSNAHLFHLPGGDVGLAVGAEARRETQHDDRDPRVDGTTTFTDSVTGVNYASDLIGTSQTPDTHGTRFVASAYGEFAIPLVSPDMKIPLVRHMEMQVAGRYEHYSDFGSVAKPKVAAAWDIVDGVRIRGSWSQGFKAPNLEQMNATLVSRSNTSTDYILCEADLRAKRISSFSACSESYSVVSQRSGNPNLKPEESTTWSAGLVLQPKFLPAGWGRMTFTADWWHVRQTGVVGVFGGTNALILDYLLRMQGSSNPNVVRAAPTSDQTAAFAGTGLAAAGTVLYVKDQYQNLLPQTAQGLDLAFNWQFPRTRMGTFALDIAAAYLDKFYRDPSPDVQTLLAARAAGLINAATPITGGGSLIAQDTRPRWRGTSSLTWSLARWQVGAFAQYTGPVYDTSLIDANGNYWQITSQLTGNLYAQYTIPMASGKGNYRVRLGVRNIANTAPPLSSSGYSGAMYNPYGRYLYANLKVDF
jgi:iron complex outermembrane recepter protein